MNYSLDYLIELAKKTGDRLIVYDAEFGKHFVIMDIDSYENLIGKDSKVVDMSESELLDQINRDIAVWRANRQQEEREMLEDELEDELSVEDIPDFGDEMDDETYGEEVNYNWHSTGNILEDRYGAVYPPRKTEDVFQARNSRPIKYQPQPDYDSFLEEEIINRKKRNEQDFTDEPIFLEEPLL